MLVAVRLWRHKRHLGTSLMLRSDSLGTLSAIKKAASKSKGLSLVLSELALEEAEFSNPINDLVHIPGIANTWPDALSRLTAPQPKSIPPRLLTSHALCPPPLP